MPPVGYPGEKVRAVNPWDLKNARTTLLSFYGNNRAGRSKTIRAMDDFSLTHDTSVIIDSELRKDIKYLFTTPDTSFRTMTDEQLYQAGHVSATQMRFGKENVSEFFTG